MSGYSVRRSPGRMQGSGSRRSLPWPNCPTTNTCLSRNSKGVYLQAEYLGSYQPLAASRAPRFALYRLRQRWSAVLRRWLPRQLDGMETAMLLADKSRLDDAVQQAFRTAGVSHLLAVSGLHLALLCGLFSFGRRWKFYKPLIILRGAVALFYVLLTGVPVSVLRAGLVFAVALAGDFLLLPFDLLTATGFAAILMGLQNAYAPCDIGFQLSFCAVLGVQAAAALTRAEERAAEDKHAAVRLLCRLAEPVQSAALASPCHIAGAGSPRHGCQPGGACLQRTGRLDAAARAANGYPVVGSQRCTVFAAVYELDRAAAKSVA